MFRSRESTLINHCKMGPEEIVRGSCMFLRLACCAANNIFAKLHWAGECLGLLRLWPNYKGGTWRGCLSLTVISCSAD